MAKTRVSGKIEWFDGAIQSNGITTMTPGASAPTISVQRRGARNASMGTDGRSGRVKAADTEYYWPNLGDGIFQIEGWFNFKQFGQTVGGQESWLFGAHRAAGQIIYAYHKNTGELGWFDGIGGSVLTGSIMTRSAWVYLSLLVNQSVAAGISGAGLYRMDNGGNVLTLIKDRTATAMGGQNVDRWQFFNASVFWTGIVSALSIYQLGSLADATIYPSDVIQPPTAPITINFANNGSTTNDGAAATPILLTTARLNDELKYGTLDNDTVAVNTTWDAGATPIMVDLVNASGVTVNFAAEPKLHADISGPATVWTLQSGTIWKTSDNSATDLANIIVWENGVPMTHPVGANFAAVAAALEASTGYYSDGAFVYVCASDHSNPNSNGKTYLRSRDRAASNAMHIRNATNLTVNNWFARYTAQVDKANNNLPYGGACAIEDVCTGFVNLVGCGGDWCGEQCFGRGTIGASLVVRRINCTYPASQSHLHPYDAVGSSQPDVDEPTDASTTQTAEYTNCTCGCNTAWTCHSNAGLMASVIFTGCNFNQGAMDTQGTCSAVTINSTTAGSISNVKAGGLSPAGTVTVNNGSRIYGPLSGSKIVLNSGVIWSPSFSCQTGNLNQQVFGVITLLGCTVDISGCTAGDASASLFYRTGAATLTVKGIIWKDGGKDIALGANFATGEIISDYNEISKVVGNRWLETYNGADATGTQAIALGIDNHSVFNSGEAAGPPNYLLKSTSQARGLVSLAAVPALAGTLDFKGHPRPGSGFTDAGAQLYKPQGNSSAAEITMFMDEDDLR